MVDVSVLAVVGVLLLAMCIWLVKSNHQFGKLLVEERLTNAKLTMTNEHFQEKIAEVDKLKETLYAFSNSLMKYKEKHGFLPWEVEEAIIHLNSSSNKNEHLLYEQSIEEYKSKYGVTPWEWEEKLIEDDPLEDFKQLHGFYPWEHEELKEEK